MRTPFFLIVGISFFSSLILLILSGFISSSLSNDSASLASLIIVFVHLYPTNLIGSYIAGRALKSHNPRCTYKSVLLLWGSQTCVLIILVGLHPFLTALSLAFLFLGKHQQKVSANT